MNLIDIVEEIIERSEPMKLVKDVQVSEHLKYHLDRNLTLEENIFRTYSDSFFSLIKEVRELYEKDAIALNDDDLDLIQSDIGEVALFEGREVYLDVPLEEDDDVLLETKHRGRTVHLNRPFRTPGGPKKFAVYVKTPGGGVKKVTFGDPKLKVRNRNKKAAKSFQARHKCSQKKDRTTAGYWSCHVGRYSKQLGLSSSNAW